MVMAAQILWQSPRLLPLAVAIAVGWLVAVLLLYGPQARRLRQPWRWGLPLLRLGVGLALAASVLQPAWVRSGSAEDRGAVVVLADTSQSMSVVDSRGAAELVAIADALGMLPTGLRQIVAEGLEDELDAVDTAIDELRAARDDVEYARLTGQGVISAQTRNEEAARRVSSVGTRLAQRGQSMPQESELATKLAALAPPAADASAAAVAQYRTGIAAARAALAGAQAAADAELYARPDVKAKCDEVGAMTRAQLVSRATRRGDQSVLDSLPAGALYGFTFDEALRPFPPAALAASQPAAVTATGLGSDVIGAVGKTLDRMKGKLVQAVVVLSDGRQVGGAGGVMSSLVPGGVPVYGVSIAPPRVRDVTIANVSVPSRQFVGETSSVRVQLRASAMKGSSVEVKLESGGNTQTRAVTFADNPVAPVDFTVKFDTPGTHSLTITAAPRSGEATVVNNTARRRVTVLDDRARVALVGSSASWGYQAFRAALSRAPWATLEAEVLDAPGARWSLPASSLDQRGAVVLWDVAAEHLLPQQWDALYRFVAERGGSLIIVAGGNTTAPQFIESPLLTDLLPFRSGAQLAWRTWPGDQPLFRLVPVPGAGDAAPLKLSDDTSSAAVERWLELPAMFQYLPLTDLKPNATPLLVERDSGAAVLTESRLGLGRVFFLGASETWRWRRGESAAAHDRFWRQLVRHATDEPYAARSGSVSLDADASVVRPGQSVRVRAKIVAPQDGTAGVAPKDLIVRRNGAQVSFVPLTPDPTGAGRYSATVNALEPGPYELQLRDPHDENFTAVLPVWVEPDVESEMRDVSGDEQLLTRLADSTGGQVLQLSQWNTLPRRLREVQQSSRQAVEQTLWDSPQLFAFVLGCLGIEWAMRKRLGLA